MASHSDTLAKNFARACRKAADEIEPPVTDAQRLRSYASDPIGFARDVLGVWPWSRQRDILGAPLKRKRVTVRSGHKVGKSTGLACLALWFYCSYAGGRVVITAKTDRQVNGIIWREIKMLARRARIRIPGIEAMGVRAITGLKDPSTFAEIVGYTAKEAEAIAGTSAPYVLYLVDEASGVEEMIFKAIEGNRAGGNAWVFLISNPTRAEGEFYDSHHSKAGDGDGQYLAIHIDSAESPNVTGEWREMREWDAKLQQWVSRSSCVPGLAIPEWIAEREAEWGRDSAEVAIRIRGEFSVAEEAKVFKLALIAEAQERWHDTPYEGRLWIGLDPAGEGQAGDVTAAARRRGQRVADVTTRRGLTPEAHIAFVHELVDTDTGTHWELPIVVVDSEGDVGYRVWVALRADSEATRKYLVHRVRPSERAIRQPQIYDRVRDELYACLRSWARDGGAIPDNPRLEKDLHAPEFAADIRGRLKLTPKTELRKRLGRSPDEGDAVTLCVWEPRSAQARHDLGGDTGAVRQPATHYDEAAQPSIDPYGALDPWRSG